MTPLQTYHQFRARRLKLPLGSMEIEKAYQIEAELLQKALRAKQMFYDDWLETFVIPPKININRKFL